MSEMRRLGPDAKVALLMHGALGQAYGKHGIGMLRYSDAEIVAVVDRAQAGKSVLEVVGIDRDVPVVASVSDARVLGAEVLLVAIAPPGGLLPDEWRDDLVIALDFGMSLVNPLHEPWGSDPELLMHLQGGAWIWDVRQEPPGLQPATGATRLLSNIRVLTVGTDMAVGKMTAAIELVKSLRNRGVAAEMVATGQVGITIAGRGVPIDAVRLDFAPGAIEWEVLRAAETSEVIVIEGQGALCHPGASANLALIRGAMPTHLLMVHRATQTHERQYDWAKIPNLMDFVRLHEDIAECCETFPRPATIGIALNTLGLSDDEADAEIERLRMLTELPVADPVRHGADVFAEALMPAISKVSRR
jgi:uncharacterized NAD-dependent epimerase/dehydratase family protein